MDSTLRVDIRCMRTQAAFKLFLRLVASENSKYPICNFLCLGITYRQVLWAAFYNHMNARKVLRLSMYDRLGAGHRSHFDPPVACGCLCSSHFMYYRTISLSFSSYCRTSIAIWSLPCTYVVKVFTSSFALL